MFDYPRMYENIRNWSIWLFAGAARTAEPDPDIPVVLHGGPRRSRRVRRGRRHRQERQAQGLFAILILGRAITRVRGFVNNFLRDPLACLGSNEAAEKNVELSENML